MTGSAMARWYGSGGDGTQVGEAARRVAADGAVLEEAPALGAVDGGPTDVVDDAERHAAAHVRVAVVVHDALHPAASAPLAVRPVGVAAVAGAHVEGDVAERLDLDVEVLAAG